MTVSSTDRTAGPFIRNGSQLEYPFEMRVFADTDLVVAKTDLDGVVSTLVLGSDYTVEINEDQTIDPGGTLVMLDVGTAGEILNATTELQATQGARLPNGSAWLPRIVESALDKLTILIQQLGITKTQLLRAPFPETLADLPSKATRADRVLAFDSNGDPTAIVGVDSGSAAALNLDLASSASGKGSKIVAFIQRLTGATARTVEDKASEIVSAADFGADGASTVADTAAINAGIAALHTAGGGILKLNPAISTSIDLTALSNQTDVLLQDERYRTAGHIAWFNTGADMEVRAHGASVSGGEGPSFVVQNNATTGDRTGSFVARYGPMGSTKVNSYFHFGVWDGAAWTPDVDWIGNGNFGGVDNFRSRIRLGAKGAILINPAGTGKNISPDTAYTDGYSLVVGRPAQDGGGYQFGVKNGAVEVPQELWITASSATLRLQNAAGANKWSLIGEFPGAGQCTFYDHGASVNRLIFATGGDTQIAGIFKSTSDNTANLGTASNRWATVYAGTGAINTSDEREKQDIEDIPQAWLDAWGDVHWQRFRFRDAVTLKGDGARWHVGLVAQRVREAFEARGLDAFAIGLLCYDKWPDEWLDHPAEYRETGLVDADSKPMTVLVREAWREKVREAGDRWGVRYDEALAMECAYLRRRMQP